jgi:nitrogen regulatory protein PII
MKVKQAIEVLQRYDLEEEIFFDVYSRADIDCLADDVKIKITDEKLSEVFDIMYKWATTGDFFDAVDVVLQGEDDSDIYTIKVGEDDES